MFQNQNSANNGVMGGGATTLPTDTNMDPTQQQQQAQNINYNNMQQQQQQQQQQMQEPNTNKNVRKKPYVKITEQPAGKALRFRYECEGRSAGSIPGISSTPENKTFPTIEIVGYKGRAVVVVSCVTKDMPYRPHPHNLVGKEGCKKGVCTLEINSETMRAVFSNLGIQCVKKKDIEAALKAREEIRVDPFKTGFSHRFQPSSIDLNSVRLCFQVFMESEQKGRFTQPLPPVVSEPIYDKKAMSDLVICRLCSCSASVLGNTQIILLCEKVAKEDIAVRFFEEKNGQVFWEAFGEFQHADVHKQTAITFKTPRYHTLDITEPAKVNIQLKRPSDGVTSDPLPFEYVPLDSGRHRFWNLRQNLKRKTEPEIFQDILAVAGKAKQPVTEVIDLNTPITEQQGIEVFNILAAKDIDEELKRRTENEVDAIIDEKVREFELQDQIQKLQQKDLQHDIQQLDIQQLDMQRQVMQQQNSLEQDLQQPNIQQPNIQQQIMQQQDLEQNIQQHELQQQEIQEQDIQQQQLASQYAMESMEADPSNQLQQQQQLDQQQIQQAQQQFLQEQLQKTQLQEPQDRIADWMKYSDLNCTDVSIIENDFPMSSPSVYNNDMSPFDDFINDVTELDSIGEARTYPTVENESINEINALDGVLSGPSATLADEMDTEDTFDDAATYSSLQIAFKNPINIPMNDLMPPTPPASHLASEDSQHYDHVEVMTKSPISTNILTSQAPPRPAPSKLTSPHMHVTAAEEEKLPPLPPKRVRKQDNTENRSLEANSTDTLDRKLRQQTPIIIMKTPDQSPPTKRLPPKPGSSGSTQSKQKKPGFFSKLFSRRKSKSDLNQNGEHVSLAGSRGGSKTTSPNASREPSIGHFQMHDSKRASMRSVKSLQPTSSSLPTSPAKNALYKGEKIGKPVGRSVSSVSGKRPAHLNADVIHIPLKGDSVNSLPHNEGYSNASTITLSNHLDRKTVSALQLADIPICDGNMELVAIADRQSLRNLCEGAFNVKLDPNVDLTEAEHFALYTSIPPQATASEFDEASAYYAAVDAGEILTPEEIAQRLEEANRLN